MTVSNSSIPRRCPKSKYEVYILSSFKLSAKCYYKQKQTPVLFYKKKLFSKIWQYSQENTCIGVFFDKVTLTATLLKRDSNTGTFL